MVAHGTFFLYKLMLFLLLFTLLDSKASGPSLSPGWGYCVVFLDKTLYSHGASLRPGV